MVKRLWAVDLSLWVSIVANALFLAFDARWFRNLGGAASCAVAALATWWLFVVFPFDFGTAAANDLGRFVLVLMLAGTLAASLVMIVLAVVDFGRYHAAPRRWLMARR